jgi:hypothetical protein
MVAMRVPPVRRPSWLLERKLYRTRFADVGAASAKVVFIRAFAAVCAFSSMVLIAWIAAFARALLDHGWRSFRTLGAASLSGASMQAGRYEEDLVPVLAVLAAFLLLAPVGYKIAFRGAAVAAGALGALDFSPPPFLATSEFSGFARGLVQFTRSWNGVLLLSLTVVAAYLLYQAAQSVFGRLEDLSAARPRRYSASRARAYAARACCVVLALAALLSATWSGAVVWLAASADHRDAAAYGLRAGDAVGDYLLALAIVAVLVTYSRSAQGWLLTAIPLAAWLGAAANVSPVPQDLAYPIARGEMARIGMAFGGGLLWAALFVGFPACLLGTYLVTRIRPFSLRRS